MPRPRFQIHLSTGLILMFLAAGLLYLNLRACGDLGWPLRIVPYSPNISITVVADPSTVPVGSANPFVHPPVQPPIPGFFDDLLIKPLLINVAVALVFLTLAAAYSEHLLRQRAQHGTLKPRLHPLSIALFLALLTAALWLNTIEYSGIRWSDFSLPRKSEERLSYFGWPFHFQDRGSLEPDVFYDVRSLVVTALALIVITALPALALHRLLRGKHRPQRAAMWLLALTLIALLTLNFLPESNVLNMVDGTEYACFEFGWPQNGMTLYFFSTRNDYDWRIHHAVANTLIALALLSLVLLLSEFLLSRRTAPREVPP